MRKFIFICLVILTLTVSLTFFINWSGFYIDFHPNAPIKVSATVSGKEILVDQGNGMSPFEIRGVDMGAGIPSHFATDYAIDKNTYLRWFRLIQDMGANCVRVYTILSDDFYNAVYEFNENNPVPLYILHGLWVNDYIMFSHRDAYDKDFLGAMLEDSRALVDIIHGNKRYSISPDQGSGDYRKDISPWVLGYILGVEWEDTTVAFTNDMQNHQNSYQGKYMYTSPEASPMEALLTQVGDRLISYETSRYKSQRLVAFANWPTTDPFEWDEIVSRYFRKFGKVDVEHIKTTDAFLSGQFASYHVYPYYPNYLGFMKKVNLPVPNIEKYTDSRGVFNSYRAYLTMLSEYHSMPVIISEYGVPASRGRAQNDIDTGRAQGGMSERDQAFAAVSCYEDIMASGCAGSVLFTWQDEWFKRTWNTMAYTDLTKTPFWCDVQTNEQHFGILSFDPGKTESICYVDGDFSEWADETPVIEKNGIAVSAKYDEAYLYLHVKKPGFNVNKDTVYIPLDITPKSGSTQADGFPVSFTRPADFLVVLDGRNNSRILVQQRYEALRAMYAHEVYKEDAYMEPPKRDTSLFVSIRLVLQMPDDPPSELFNSGLDVSETFDTGKLIYGNGNPSSPTFNSLADFNYTGDDIEIRLPWLLLNFSNPSEMMIHDDYYEHYGVENLPIDEIYVGAGGSDSLEEPIPMGQVPLKGWGRNPTYHERLREGYYALKRIWTAKN